MFFTCLCARLFVAFYVYVSNIFWAAIYLHLKRTTTYSYTIERHGEGKVEITLIAGEWKHS